MSREEYIRSNLDMLLYHWSNIATKVGSYVIISLIILDYFVTPSNFKTFLLYRIFAAGSIYSIYLVNKQKVDRNRQNAMTILAGIVVCTMVALMIAKIGGHQSPYFAGIMLSVVYVIGLIPVSVNISIIASTIMY